MYQKICVKHSFPVLFSPATHWDDIKSTQWSAYLNIKEAMLSEESGENQTAASQTHSTVYVQHIWKQHHWSFLLIHYHVSSILML